MSSRPLGGDGAERTNDNAESNMDAPEHEEDSNAVHDSYFGQQRRADGTQGLPSTSSVPLQQEAVPFTPTQTPAPNRTTTAPKSSGVRPAAGQRASTLLGRLTRRTTGADVHDGPYSYTFDSLSSDSSSSEDEEPTETSKPAKRSTATRPSLQTDATDFADKQERRKREKRGHSYTRFALGDENVRSKGRVSKRDGRLNISVNETANSGYVAKALAQITKHHIDVPRRKASRLRQRQDRELEETADEDAESIAASLRHEVPSPRLNIVVMVIGSRGDIQPFIKVGKILQDQGHRVRIATHPTFSEFVHDQNGLEFFSIGGDPSELMAFMVKNPGLIPKMQTIREGEIQKRRRGMAEMFEGFWRACISATDDERDAANRKMLGDKAPFIADAIIANPPSMAHVHIAEKLGIPLHMMFTFPYSPTQQFPHPVANIRPQKSNVDPNYVNFMSYPLVEMMTWQGLGDIVNRFREKTLGLEPVSSLWAPGALYRMKVPYTYMWSPALVPKPKDWGPEIDIAGFVFLDLASKFKPDKDLEAFLSAGEEPPVYVGFGSIVLDDPDAMTEMIIEGAKMAGVRVLINKGWGGLGRDNANTPDHVFMLGNTPHDWLFPRVKAVVHHGGAGTTAIGLKCGKPTMIVPFFGDQPFWGAMVAAAKAGAHQCIPYKNMTIELFAEGIKQCLTEEAQANVQKIADSIAREGDGAENAVKSFHRSLPLAGRPNMRCSILEDRVAVWQLRNSSLRLSALAAELLHQSDKLHWHDLKLIRHYEWNDFDGPGEPITGTVGAVTDSLYGIGEGVGMVPVRIAQHIRKHEEHQKKKQEMQRRREAKKQRKAAQSAGKATEQEVAAPAANNQRPRHAREDTTATEGSALSADPEAPLPKELAGDVGHGLKRSGAALVTMPNDVFVAIAQGLHNAPRLWGDATVRKPVRITGFKSGVVAARKELTYGIYDAWTGLVKQPMGDWQDGDTVPAKFAGLGVGFSKGVGGFVLKNVSAVVGPPAYIGKGIVKYVEKKAEGPGTKSFIRKARIVQGQNDVREIQGKEQEFRQVKERVNEGWTVYEEIWHSAHHQFAPTGHNLVGRLKFSKEKRSWDDNGALENIDTANRALRAHEHGQDIDQLFAKRKLEMRKAERPRVSAMEPPHPEKEDKTILPNGHEADTSHADAHGDEEDMEDEHSDSTAVASEEEDAKHNDSATGHVKFKANDVSPVPDTDLANRGLVVVQ